jgi:hypothetical protein
MDQSQWHCGKLFLQRKHHFALKLKSLHYAQLDSTVHRQALKFLARRVFFVLKAPPYLLNAWVVFIAEVAHPVWAAARVDTFAQTQH